MKKIMSSLKNYSFKFERHRKELFPLKDSSS